MTAKNKTVAGCAAGVRGFAATCVLSLLVLASMAYAGEPTPTITFSLDFPQSNPEHYSITVQADGRARYESSGKMSADAETSDSYEAEFRFSEPNRARIFDLAAQAHYFSGKIDAGKKNMAFTGAKKLGYSDGQRISSAEYNVSNVPAVEQLTALFQNVSTTMEFGRRLAYFHRYQKLALDDELKQMEDQARRGELAELQAVKPVLQEIYDDNSVLKTVRARAGRIMQMPASPAVR